MPQPPDVVIVIPTLNEAAHLGAVLDGLLADGVTAPIWIVDGGSTDATRTIAASYAAAIPGVALIDNPARAQAAAVNLAARRATAAGARVMIRMDAHARYPAGFVAALLDRLEATGADSVAVPLIARGVAGWQAAAAALQRGWLGHGGATHRRRTAGGWVDHGHHAAVRLDRFLALGGYDTRFAANEDAEFDLRLTAGNGRIWLAGDLPVTYLPRTSPAALARQMARNGRWRMETLLRHRRRPALRQALPMAAAMSLPLAALAPVWPLLALPAASYLGAVATLSATSAGLRLAPAVALLAILSHLAFGGAALARLAAALPGLRASPGRQASPGPSRHPPPLPGPTLRVPVRLPA